MIEFMTQHERYVQTVLDGNPGADALRDLLGHHDKQIRWMQHERMAHLITMLFVCLFALLSLWFAIASPAVLYFTLSGLLIILSLAYLLHYFRLENGIQKWYRISNDIRLKSMGEEFPPK